jgi:ERCC4-related helicase
MMMFHPYLQATRLHVEGRISAEDAARQERTAREILKCLVDRPGVILADEVGMGKTFVALAVAASVALNNPKRLPVVVMVPPALREKWTADFSVFCEKCLPSKIARTFRSGSAERATRFLKLLDDPLDRRKSVIFLTHGAMRRGLSDRWVMLGVIYQSLLRRHGSDRKRQVLGRVLGELLRMGKVHKQDSGVWMRLLKTHPSNWKLVLEKSGIQDWGSDDANSTDDPVPKDVWRVLPKLDLSRVYDAIHEVPIKMSPRFHERVAFARDVIQGAIKELWNECLLEIQLKLPLLILDEAHHLKNADTKLASLFETEDAREDAEAVTRGPLGGVFERMLFLTATPFQLGHSELCSVLDRFDGINWSTARPPTCGQDGFRAARERLRSALDAAQQAAVALDHAWGRLRPEDLTVNGTSWTDSGSWWSVARRAPELSGAAADVVRCFEHAKTKLKEAELEIRPFIIRHLKIRHLPGERSHLSRREKHVGRAIMGESIVDEQGIPVSGESLLPFLLAARAVSQAPESRPVFAEGLASSYEAFLHTRHSRGEIAHHALDEDDDDRLVDLSVTDSMAWYLNHLEALLLRSKSSAAHPKVAATIDKVVDIWRRGEKLLVFCHYIATGRILRQRISEAVKTEIIRLGASKLDCPEEEVWTRLEAIGKRFFDQDSPLRRACDDQASAIVGEYPVLVQSMDDIVDIVRRNIRTPAFLVRFFPLERQRLDEDAAEAALNMPDLSGLTLKMLLRQFFSFLVDRCSNEERFSYLEAVNRIQIGTHFGHDTTQEYSDDELQGDVAEQLLPNVRLVNGTTKPETRRRLMLTFNTPFYPEVLVASSVMAEGVDLHLNCRHVIHHDLCWNPSTLEQRTGRVDRIGAKAETSGRPIQIYLPFVAETQDEKMYRVVTDRERWFHVVMGEEYRVDARTTELLAERVPFPQEAAAELAFDLGIACETGDRTKQAPEPAMAVEG